MMSGSRSPGHLSRVLALWRMEEGEILSPLSVQECRARLAAQTEGPLVFHGPGPLRGIVRPNWARLRKNIRLNNSFQTILVLSMESMGSATRLSWRIGASAMARLFMAAWLVGVVAVVIVGLASGLTDLLFLGPAAIVILAVGTGLAVFGRRMARGQDRFLLQTVTELVEGRPRS